MKKKERKTLIKRACKKTSTRALLLLTFFFITIAISAKFISLKGMVDEQYNEDLSLSGYWVLTDPIEIDDHGTNNWAWTAATYDWCSGEGTLANPYRIENVTLDLDDIVVSIQITNSRKHFIMNNCYVRSYMDLPSPFPEPPTLGIVLNNVTNGRLVDIDCQGYDWAIALQDCNYNSISESLVIYNTWGMYVYNSDFNSITGNVVSNNGWGIYLYCSNNNNISGNAVDRNGRAGYCSGITLNQYCNNNTIIENSANDNHFYGIFLNNSCSFNKIIGNNASNIDISDQVDGIMLRYNCHGNTISRNTVCGHEYNGIMLWENCDSNTISGNIASDNLRDGIHLQESCDENTILENNASNVKTSNQDSGIYLDGTCLRNTLSGNNANNNTENGIYLYNNRDNTVLENSLKYNINGISLFGCRDIILSGNTANNNLANGIILSSRCYDNAILGNTISENSDRGIYLKYYYMEIYNNNISINTISENHNYGIYIEDNCHDNTVFYNFLIENGVNAMDLSAANYWDSGAFGNYWDDYLGTDDDDDGIGDTPYNISETPLIQDRYPLIHGNVNPLANFTANATSIIEGEHVQFNFTGNQGNRPARFEWDFGDGTNSTERDPVHQYAANGTYTVNLTVTDFNGDMDRAAMIITVLEDLEPVANFTANATSIIEGEHVQFNFTGVQGNGPARFEWDFGDGTNSTERDPVHQYATDGTYIVKLTVIDSDGDVNSTEITVIVDPRSSSTSQPFSPLTVVAPVVGASATVGAIATGIVLNKKKGLRKA